MFSSLVDVNLVLFCGRVETSMNKKISKKDRRQRLVANFASSARKKNNRRLKQISSKLRNKGENEERTGKIQKKKGKENEDRFEEITE